jgi:hypothetical protein
MTSCSAVSSSARTKEEAAGQRKAAVAHRDVAVLPLQHRVQEVEWSGEPGIGRCECKYQVRRARSEDFELGYYNRKKSNA